MLAIIDSCASLTDLIPAGATSVWGRELLNGAEPKRPHSGRAQEKQPRSADWLMFYWCCFSIVVTVSPVLLACANPVCAQQFPNQSLGVPGFQPAKVHGLFYSSIKDGYGRAKC